MNTLNFLINVISRLIAIGVIFKMFSNLLDLMVNSKENNLEEK